MIDGISGEEVISMDPTMMMEMIGNSAIYSVIEAEKWQKCGQTVCSGIYHEINGMKFIDSVRSLHVMPAKYIINLEDGWKSLYDTGIDSALCKELPGNVSEIVFTRMREEPHTRNPVAVCLKIITSGKPIACSASDTMAIIYSELDGIMRFCMIDYKRKCAGFSVNPLCESMECALIDGQLNAIDVDGCTHMIVPEYVEPTKYP
jgi:hypothetical protein